MGIFKPNWPLRILARAQRIAGGKKLLDICERDETIAAMQSRMRSGAKPVTALSDMLLAELPEEEARGHSLKQLAGEATAHICENIIGAVRLTGSRVIMGDPLFSSGTGFRERGKSPAANPGSGERYVHLVRGVIAALPDADLAALATLVAVEQENRKTA